MPRHLPLVALIATVALAASQSAPSIPLVPTPPVRSLGPVVATSNMMFRGITQVAPLSDGRVIVTDTGRRVVALLDTALVRETILLDSTAGRNGTFKGGPTPSRLVGFGADTSLLFDPAGGAFVLVHPDGVFGRAIAFPAGGLARMVGAPMVASTQAIVFTLRQNTHPYPKTQPGDPDYYARFVDSAHVIRLDPATRAIDTLAHIGNGREWILRVRTTGTSGILETALMPFYDEAVVATDGTVAIFHAREYRFEWLAPGSGRSLPGARLAYAWTRIADRERQRVLDSANAWRMRAYDSLVAARAADSVRQGHAPTRTVDSPGALNFGRQIAVPPVKPPRLASADEIPDFRPPTRTRAVLADADNRVWVSPVVQDAEPGFAIWEVIDRVNGVVDRLRIPESRTIVGFGTGGVVYLAASQAGGVRLEKVLLK